MIDFIELTSTNGENSIWVRPELIEDIIRGTGQSKALAFVDLFFGSDLVMCSGKEISVRETQDEVLMKIEDHKTQIMETDKLTLREELIFFYRWIDENGIYKKKTTLFKDIDDYLKIRDELMEGQNHD